jgi:hypothetical protein
MKVFAYAIIIELHVLQSTLAYLPRLYDLSPVHDVVFIEQPDPHCDHSICFQQAWCVITQCGQPPAGNDSHRQPTSMAHDVQMQA